MSLSEHPTVIAHRKRGNASDAPTPLDAQKLRERCLAAGADDVGFVDIADPALDDQRAFILAAFPQTRALVAFVTRMNREDVRTPARSIANAEFHRTRDDVDMTARAIVAELERDGIPAVNPPMAFPLEMEQFPNRTWVVSHKPVAVAAGLGRVGIHRNVIHPRFGNFILLGTVLLGRPVDRYDSPLEYNPCLECKLCVAACPTGAIEPDGSFNFASCYTHNYREFMSGFSDFVETVADSGSAAKFRENVTLAETASMWQSLSYGANYKAAYCLSVCPAGEDVIGPFLENRGRFLEDVVKPLQAKVETVYVTPGSDASAHVAKRFPHKRTKTVRSGLRLPDIATFLSGLALTFQRHQTSSLQATYHLRFTGRDRRDATVRIDRGTLDVSEGLVGTADLRITADSRAWIDFVNRERPLWRLLVTGKIRARGPLRLFIAFGRAFSS
jgi:ferredoxin